MVKLLDEEYYLGNLLVSSRYVFIDNEADSIDTQIFYLKRSVI